MVAAKAVAGPGRVGRVGAGGSFDNAEVPICSPQSPRRDDGRLEELNRHSVQHAPAQSTISGGEAATAGQLPIHDQGKCNADYLAQRYSPLE